MEEHQPDAAADAMAAAPQVQLDPMQPAVCATNEVVAAFRANSRNLGGAAEPPERLPATAVTPGTFELLRVRPAIVRGLIDSDPPSGRGGAVLPRDAPTGGGARVYSITERHEPHAASLPLVEQHHQVTEIPPETIEPPTNHRADLVPTPTRPSHVDRWKTPLVLIAA